MRADPTLNIARQWIIKARNDLLCADNNLASSNVPCDTVCFHCQQAAEKILKAALAAEGIPPPRTHILPVLAEQLVEMFPSVVELADELAALTPYAIASRYPDDGDFLPTLSDALEARQFAENVLLWVKDILPMLTEET